ncbi:hypothetical protein FRC18_012188 [Serendipita sp. 400]|nr:hypothetical protein FRC18_012188 [Serendipita sp. 400]
MAAPAVSSTSGAATKHSSPIKPSPAMINPRIREEWSKFVYPHRNTEISIKEMLEKLCPDHSGQDLWVKRSRNTTKRPSTFETDQWIECLNQISLSIKTDQDNRIVFAKPGEKPPDGHPTGTKCRPDIVAFKQHSPPNFNMDNLHWAHLEATGEIKSSGKSKETSGAQAAGYTSYHLQARPDRVSVSGIWIKDQLFRIFFTDASQVFHTPQIVFRGAIAGQMLFAFVWSLYHPQLDRSITINLDELPPTFNVRVGSDVYRDLKLAFTGEAIGRRTTIMMEPDECGVVIKEQYIEKGRRFAEGDLLKKIHKKGTFPGVVRVRTYGPVTKKDPITVTHTLATGHSITRGKTRLVLEDEGTLLAKEKTIKRLLMCIYDLLEVIRNLDKHRQILHRDISMGNILVRKAPRSGGKAFAKDLDDMCFCACLLDHLGDQEYEPSLEERLHSDVLLTDFDSGEDKDPNNPNITHIPQARTGTPTFMARVVRNAKHFAAFGVLPPTPPVHPKMLSRFEELLPDRCKKFPAGTKEELILQRQEKEVLPTDFRHQLRYDAESVFWFLVWWSLLAQPGDGSPEELIPHSTWSTLTGPEDLRHENYITSDKNLRLHSAYKPLFYLLDAMRQHLLVDSELCTDKMKQEPEYLIEVFQRLILDFLIENQGKAFMVLEKSDEDRRVAPDASAGVSTSNSVTGKSISSRSGTHRSSAYRSMTHNSIGNSTNTSVTSSMLPPPHPGSSSTTHSTSDSPLPTRPIELRSSKRILANQARSTLNTSNTSAGTKRSFQEVDKDPDPAQSESPVRHKKQRPLDPPVKSNSAKNQPETPPTPRRSTRRRRSDE